MQRFQGMKARSVGPAGMSGRITALDAVVSDPTIIYAGSASGGLWKSESGGIHWTPIFDTLEVASIGALAIQQSNPSVVWVGTGEGNPRNSQTSGYGVYRSHDAGRTWQHMGLEKTRNIHRIIIDPNNPDVVYVGAQGSAWGNSPDRGVFKTTDGGKTWEKILYLNERAGVGEMVMDPTNPQKLMVNLWEFRRTPWFFESGGSQTGLFVTHNGGKNWERRTSENGLPKGNLGRMGLAIAKSNPKIVYALIESEKNALYRSEDGGFQFSKVNDGKEIGDRPFYYYEIFVDPTNENRLYSLFSLVSMSEDGGKSFRVILPYEGVHPDHHAWWINPNDPRHIIEGNDGGMAITYDMGKTWRFIENLPLAQYYHINIDNELPYNIYGGMQDNGSWRGPAYVLREGGIRNNYWAEVFFGDGFDVMPDPDEPNRYGYAMSQGGFLGRYDLLTGASTSLKPHHPEGVKLRFNWNSAIAQDPFNHSTIYYGSQFVHKSTDKGQTWTLISPDLTTNDPNKQKQLESGGLTLDVTSAENHTTILAIAPSPVKEGVIWAGTDDGNLQVTQDGGKTWTNVIGNIRGIPKNCWIPQIHASTYQPGEAFVVLNNYRMDDWTPYLFQTTDYGKTWKRLADPQKVWGYMLSFVQDPIEPKLMFAGTEFGLYVSFDAGNNWNKWKAGYPTVSTMDLKIQPREHDLVIGTFGRSAYVLDDIRPLREIATKGTSVLEKTVHAFLPPDAYQFEIGEAMGTRFAANAIFAGENRPFGAMLTYAVKEGAPKTGSSAEKQDKVQITITDAKGKTIRTFSQVPQQGVNRVYWDLSEAGVRTASANKPKPDAEEPGGAWVMPGVYQVKYTWKNVSDSVKVKVADDPRMALKEADLVAWSEIMGKVSLLQQLAFDMNVQLIGAKEAIELVEKQLPEPVTPEATQLKAQGKQLLDEIKALQELIIGKQEVQGIFRNPDALNARIGNTNYLIGGSRNAPTPNQLILLQQTDKAVEQVMGKVNQFFSTQWKAYQEAAAKSSLSPFRGEFRAFQK